jgi:hypothetical protein
MTVHNWPSMTIVTPLRKSLEEIMKVRDVLQEETRRA